MINFIHYQDDAFELYKKAVEAKREKGDKECLKKIEGKVEIAYSKYKTAFVQKGVHTLLPEPSFTDSDREALLGLYGSNKKIIRDIRTWIDEHNKRTYLNICPYCTFNSANTIEHILPKATYQEYAVHALNLIPCCSECNSKKGNQIQDEKGSPLILNFYYDKLPNKQFLFVDLFFDNKGVINFNYRLDNINNIDNGLFLIIQNHFKKLDLLDRFKTRAVSRYVEIENSLLVDMKGKDVSYCMDSLKEKTIRDAAGYGHNHWMVVLKLALADSVAYKNYLSNKCNSSK